MRLMTVSNTQMHLSTDARSEPHELGIYSIETKFFAKAKYALVEVGPVQL